MEVVELLKAWGFEESIEIFKDNDLLDFETFSTLNENDLREIFPTLGLRKKFMNKLNAFLFVKQATDETVLTAEETISPSPSTSTGTTDSIELVNDLPDNVTFAYPHKATLGLPYEISDHKNSVRTLLEGDDEGKLIIASYGKKFLRSKLCELIIKSELKKSEIKKITASRFAKLALEINEVFLHEDPEIYFVPYTKNEFGKPKSARGKLWSTYCYIRRTLKSFGLISTFSKEEEDSDKDNEPDDVLEAVEWLKNNSAPFNSVLENWKLTTRSRIKNFPSSVGQYLKLFPALNEPLGYLLLEEDFSIIYPESKNKLFLVWPTLYRYILQLASSKRDSYLTKLIDDYHRSDLGVDDIFTLTVLPLLFSSVNLKSKRPGSNWRPSKSEIRQGFLLHIKDIGDLEIQLNLRRQKYATFNLTAQPIPILVGELNNITACYVCIDDVKYKVDTPLKAVDLCFKSFFTLDAEYPKECDAVWMFIQKYIYEIYTKHDRKYIGVSSLISDINKLKDGM